MSRDNVEAVLREGAMTLPSSIILILIDAIESRNAALDLVPRDWAMSHGELAAEGII